MKCSKTKINMNLHAKITLTLPKILIQNKMTGIRENKSIYLFFFNQEGEFRKSHLDRMF